MTTTVESLLGTTADDYELRRRLHDVPPHEVYEVEFDGRRAVCKVSVEPRGTAGVEGRVMRYLDRSTSVPVPEVYVAAEDGFVGAFCEDAPDVIGDGESVLEPEWIRAAGRTLGRLHAASPFDRPGLLVTDGDPTAADAGLRVDAAPDASWADALDDLLGVYETAVEGTGFADVVADAREFVATHADRFRVLQDRDPALLHGWFTPEHVAVEEGAVQRIVDFEHTLVGSGEWDYWRTAIPLFYGRGWDTPEDPEETFRAAYESVRPLPAGFEERSPAYRALVAVSYLDSLHTQTGIDEDTREKANAIGDHATESLAAVREDWE